MPRTRPIPPPGGPRPDVNGALDKRQAKPPDKVPAEGSLARSGENRKGDRPSGSQP